jgi:hypothetical protein
MSKNIMISKAIIAPADGETKLTRNISDNGSGGSNFQVFVKQYDQKGRSSVASGSLNVAVPKFVSVPVFAPAD